MSRLLGERPASGDAVNRSALRPGQKSTPPQKRRISFWYWAIIFLALLWAQSVFSHRDTQAITYDAFLQDLRNGHIAEVVLSDSEIRGRYVAADRDGRKAFVTARVDPAVAADLWA
ncbi:ATP-dependent metallopeptidase FtsH/Yme1/Tma family protein [Sphingomonas sp. YR710]|uniref:ATP-dependent metallopeptidase FtsH/Yme1/Tma family protein n=1 Tax=Sphingomonas sp. YR710 TaxID=1882773 RepID=UPI000B89887E|nr:ATP-dependent metallopeptidase FtsH/Yme1/Tma family protein [Sphingomonas sp. YR710]